MATPLFQKIMVAIDGSPASEKALAAAVDLASHYAAELVAVGVADVPEVAGTVGEFEELSRGTECHFRQIGEAAVEYARSRGVLLRSVVLRGHIADALLRFAEGEDVNLVVLGEHGHSRIKRFFLGSTSDRVSEHSHCTVMIAK
jgi:nucleotide-binding universal stress UspA family protein